MYVFYSLQDLGKPSGPGLTWLAEELATLVHTRGATPQDVRQIVDGYDDGARIGPYKYHVPAERLLRHLERRMLGGTRYDAVHYLAGALRTFGAGENEINESEAMSSRYDFDSFVGRAIGRVVHFPLNIFRGASTGDGGGRELDWPGFQNHALEKRLKLARTTLHAATGVRLDQTVPLPSSRVDHEVTVMLDGLVSSGRCME